jgi:ABC-2 type transport system permease protein
MIRSGAIAYELCRPLDLYNLWFARAAATRTAPTMLRAAPMVAVAMFGLPLIGLDEWRLQTPRLENALAFSVAMVCALLLSCALTTLMNISLMWTVGGDGVTIILTTLVALGAGLIIPLPLFPDWAQPLLMVLPFAGLMDLPYRIYLGAIPLFGIPAVFLHQILWTVGLVFLGRRLLARGMRRVVVQGG